MANKKDKNHYGMVKDPLDLADHMSDVIENPPEELTERQRRILKYRIHGMTQTAIAKLEKVSQPMIAKEMRRIKKVFADKGRQIDQEVVVGETTHLYGEVEKRGWEMYFTHKDDKPASALKALETVMGARERTLKLLMDVGLMKKVATEHEHTLKVAPFVQQFEQLDPQEKQAALKNVIDVQLQELQEPEPPQLVPEIQLAELEEPEAPDEQD